MSGAERSRVVALAGRRIDPPGAEVPRFPLAAVPAVRERLREWLAGAPTAALVSSAACGADLTALSIAADLGIRTRVVLPFGPARFRQTSVVDRPGGWGEIFDRILERVNVNDDLVVLTGAGERSTAYAAVNAAILDEATDLATPGGWRREAAIMWEGHSRGDDDLTAAFARLARERGFIVTELSTREAASRSPSHRMI